MSKSSYNEIFKATSLFGGVQVFNIIIAIIRSKVIALLLGPAGIGISGLFTSTTSFIASLTNFGLSTSAVKSVASSYSSGDADKLSVTVSVFKGLVLITGFLGFVLTLVLSPWLSRWTFGDYSYTVPFVFLSITLLINQLNVSHNVVLRGTRKIKYIAQASLIGSLLGLITSIPLYYFWKERGIVPAIVVSAIVTLAISWYYSRKVNIPVFRPNTSLLLTEGKEMIRLGFLINMSTLITLGTSLLVRIFINSQGSINDVGLYIAGFSLVNTYVGMVFSAMSTDYYPRLAGVSHDNIKCSNEINQQLEIALIILTPIIAVFLVFSKYAVILLYSHKFLPISSMLLWAAIGIFFKAGSWAIAFVFMAKSAGKVYFVNELIANIYLLIFNIVGYHLGGLTGLGISFLISYILYFIQVFVVSNRLYNFKFSEDFWKIFLKGLMLIVLCFLVQFANSIVSYSIGTLIILSSIAFSYIELNKRTKFVSALKNKMK